MALSSWRKFFDGMKVCNTYAVDRLFAVCDVDGNKSIDSKEFLWGLSTLCHGKQEERLQYSMRFYDLRYPTDPRFKGALEVSRKEFLYYLKQFRIMCAAAVKHAAQQIRQVYGLDTVQLNTAEAR